MTRTVICGVDHAPRSSTVVEAAATLADGLGAELVLAHSRQAPSTPLGRAAPHAGFAGWPPLEPDTETSAEELHSELLPYGLRSDLERRAHGRAWPRAVRARVRARCRTD